MPSASIRSKRNGASPLVGVSRDDLVVGDVVLVQSVNVHTTYAWTLAYRPVGSTAVFSGVSSASSPGTFTVDKEGPYLVRLTADLGLGTESTQYVRLRYVTVFGGLKLVAAGEGYGGALPVPVDQTATGWTDTLNTNLTTLLGLIARDSTSSRVFYVDPTVGDGDYQTIQAAINAAVIAGAALATPYVILVRPGLYVENVTFQPFVHVRGWPGNPVGITQQPIVSIRGTHVVSTPGGTDTVILSDLTLVNITLNTNPVVEKTGTGRVVLLRNLIEQDGLGAGQGAALLLTKGTAFVDSCTITANAALADDRVAIKQTGALVSSLTLVHSTVTGPSGLVLNTASGAGISANLRDVTITTSGATSTGIASDAGVLTLDYVTVQSASGNSLLVHPSGGVFATGQSVAVRWSKLGGVSFDKTGIVGATSLTLGASEYSALTFPGGALGTLAATTQAATVFYDNATSGLTASDVQAAIDEVVSIWNAVQTLDDAYNGGVPASGNGRTINASAGSVQVTDAAMPSDPPPAGNTDGMMEVVGKVRVGALGFPEVDVDPNPYGSGPMILMGNRVVPNNIPFGAGTARIMGHSTGDPLYRNYNLRVQTQSSLGGGGIGRLIFEGGDGLNNAGATPDAASIYVQAGSAFNVAANPGNVYISPGRKVGGAAGSIVLARPVGSTAATLTAAGACADPIGVDGSISFATNTGAVSLTVAAADTRAAVVAALSALEGISASQALGVITLTSDHEGPNAEIYFLSATAGVDAAIGVFDGQVQVDGTFGGSINVRVTANQEVSFGVGGGAGPLVYNATTGKLTVPGIIDPTALVLTRAAAPTTTAIEGALFVSDGSGGLTVGHLYYRGASNAVPIDLTP